ncbi:MAG: hypothetical protein R2784_07165 [Saprospiraceae bacterium]
MVKLLKAAKQTTCTECSGDKKNKPIEGMVIIEDLEPYKYYWANGEILDLNQAQSIIAAPGLKMTIG